MPQLYSFTGLKIGRNNSEIEQNQNTDKQKELVHQASPKPKTKIPQKERKNRKMTETILPQDQKEKSEHRKLSRLGSQPRKNYKTFIPQS